MKRRIIEINQDKCNGCGLCVEACHEGAIALQNGKAVLTRDDYCDGLGDCLPSCPVGAISFVQRDALAYDEAAVQANMKKKQGSCTSCPGSAAKALTHPTNKIETKLNEISQLRQWPVQIKLAPIKASYYDQANVLIAADCSAYAYAKFHETFMKGKIVLIGCPKLDQVDYHEKLCAILCQNDIKSVSVVRMEVPCCGGIEQACKTAIQQSGKFLPWQIITISTDGRILE